MAKLNEEAIEEIFYLINEVQDVVRLLEEFGINITSDTWTATSFCNKENILTWNKKDLNKINNDSNINIGDEFYVGDIITGYQHEYKGMPLIAPKELAEVQGEIFKQYLESIINKISLKHFNLEFKDDYGLTDNCGWEHYLCITATVKKPALQTDKTRKLIKEIILKCHDDKAMTWDIIKINSIKQNKDFFECSESNYYDYETYIDLDIYNLSNKINNNWGAVREVIYKVLQEGDLFGIGFKQDGFCMIVEPILKEVIK